MATDIINPTEALILRLLENKEKLPDFLINLEKELNNPTDFFF